MIVNRQLPAPGSVASQTWRRMIRFDSVSADWSYFSAEDDAHRPEKRVLAEGDSWFDKFTPIPISGANLLDAIRTPWHTAVFDVSKIGDTSSDMVSGWQARQTRTLLNLFEFDLILLSAGGNDLKNLYAEKLDALDEGGLSPAEITSLVDPATYAAEFATVIEHIRSFVAMRDAAGRATNRRVPILINGYDYFQPRPARAPLFDGGRMGAGPWVYPVLKGVGLHPLQMKAAADAVVDSLNRALIDAFGASENVHVVDSRGILQPAHSASTGLDGDWLDEIHPSKDGFDKLAEHRWNGAVAHFM